MKALESKIEELPDEVVIRALTSALCHVYEGEIEINIDGVGMQINVEPDGISILGCHSQTDKIFGQRGNEVFEDAYTEDNLFLGSMAVTGV